MLPVGHERVNFNLPLDQRVHPPVSFDQPEDEDLQKIDGNIYYVMSAGITNIFFLPSAFRDAIKQLSKAISIKDTGEMAETLVRLCNIPIGFAQAVKRAFVLSSQFLGKALISVALVTYALACQIIFIVVETFLEIARYCVLIKFEDTVQAKQILKIIEDLNIDLLFGGEDKQGLRKKIVDYINRMELRKNLIVEKLGPKSVELIQTIERDLMAFADTGQGKAEIILNAHSLLQSYVYNNLSAFAKEYLGIAEYSIDGKLSNDKNERIDQLRRRNILARKVRPVVVSELVENVPIALHYLSIVDKKNYGIKSAERIYKKIALQIQKTEKVYALGIAAMLIAGIGIMISSAMVPAIVLGCIGTTIEFIRYFAPQSYLDQPGEKWSWEYWTPSFLRPKYKRTPGIEMQEMV